LEAGGFHTGGIFAALSETTLDVVLEAVSNRLKNTERLFHMI
jgi:hypothetical protein